MAYNTLGGNTPKIVKTKYVIFSNFLVIFWNINVEIVIIIINIIIDIIIIDIIVIIILNRVIVPSISIWKTYIELWSNKITAYIRQ